MNHIALGSVSFFVNLPRGAELDAQDERDLALAVVAEFEEELGQSPLRDQVLVQDIVYRRGCLITTISLCAVAAAAHVFIKDYTKLREGVIEICKDVQRASIALKRWSAAQQIWWYREDIFDPALLRGAAKITPVEPARRGLARLAQDKTLIQKE